MVEDSEDPLEELPPRHPPQFLAVHVEFIDLVELVIEHEQQGRDALGAHIPAQVASDLREARRRIQQHVDGKVGRWIGKLNVGIDE